MHKVLPNQVVKIMQIEIAVPADAPFCEIADEVSALLSENGCADPESNILDWRYTGEQRIVTASADPVESEVFGDPLPIEDVAWPVKTAEELEAELRATWTAQGITPERQAEILADLEQKATPEGVAQTIGALFSKP